MPPDGHPCEDEIARLLLEASFDLIAGGGWSDFSLRAVADAIGAAGSAASHRFGDRAGLITAVCEAAIERERAQMDLFLPGVEVDDTDTLAALLHEWLDQWVRQNRKQARACSELLLVSHRDAACRAFGPRWMGLCRAMISRLHPQLSEQAGRDLAAFLLVEAGWWLLLADDAQFRLASAEALRRVAMLAEGAAGPLPVFWLRRGLGLPGACPPPEMTGTKLKIIEATAGIIADCGVQALTHREIAKRSGASLSSLTYHFETLGDLIRNGFQLMFAPGRPPPAMPGRAVAGYELALQALRDPLLTPLAASVRRRFACDRPGAETEGDPQQLARREASTMLQTAAVLAS